MAEGYGPGTEQFKEMEASSGDRLLFSGRSHKGIIKRGVLLHLMI